MLQYRIKQLWWIWVNSTSTIPKQSANRLHNSGDVFHPHFKHLHAIPRNCDHGYIRGNMGIPGTRNMKINCLNVCTDLLLRDTVNCFVGPSNECGNSERGMARPIRMRPCLSITHPIHLAYLSHGAFSRNIVGGCSQKLSAVHGTFPTFSHLAL